MWVPAMSKIALEGYRPIERRWPVYALNLKSGEVDTQWFANQKEGLAAGPKQGMGDFRKIGRWLRKSQRFFAFYAAENSLFLWLDGIRLDVLRDEVSIKRRVDFLLRKHFIVHVGGSLVFDCRYSYLDYEDFPDKDIFWHITKSLATKEMRIRTLLLWRDKAAGKTQSTDEYIRDLTERVNSMMAKGKVEVDN